MNPPFLYEVVQFLVISDLLVIAIGVLLCLLGLAQPLLAWYDGWIGWFYDRKARRLYVLPVPMCGFVMMFRKPQGIDFYEELKKDAAKFEALQKVRDTWSGVARQCGELEAVLKSMHPASCQIVVTGPPQTQPKYIPGTWEHWNAFGGGIGSAEAQRVVNEMTGKLK